MTTRGRWISLAAVALVVLLTAGGYAIHAYTDYRARQAAPSAADISNDSAILSGNRVLFRNTAAGQDYGLVAAVAIADPAGGRVVTSVACDRVYSTTAESATTAETATMCLRANRGVVTTFEAIRYDENWKVTGGWPLAGVPSRTRISADGLRASSTAFVTGHSYAAAGFSTQALISEGDGMPVNIEDFSLIVDGQELLPVDRNTWGVTFASDPSVFYATAASATLGTTWLVRGRLDAKTLTAIRENAECPSLSPDGTRVAYKKNYSTGVTPNWAVAVLDLATGIETVLPESRSVDDQAEWLDDATLLYAVPRSDAVGDSDVWRIAADGESPPTLYIEHAWSPSVVRP